ncbi:hypothetical protein F511_07509 [Dorcoceras hygrometricum]|uniref:Uncharacterized protein n=1 Tax=Dorcoceras hygrometricum TaxID=472368 RepID=A0A2Z7CX52_9LAMI|nr:hypothetical protein F511_07509 [Dorcoceras hygrometricum]
MASSLISNTNQVYFASVLAMDNTGMVAMFEALVTSGLNGFLGCLSDIYEAALVESYQNALGRDGKVIITVQGKLVEISEEVFARTFQLPVKGLTDMNEVPKDLVFDARSEFSFTGEQLTTSCKKRELKIEFRLLCDILEKSVTVKAGSFEAITHERFLMITAINGGKRPVAAVDEPVVKKKQTRIGKAAVAATDSELVSVAHEAVPLQVIKPITATPPNPKCKASQRRLKLPAGSDDEIDDKDAALEDVAEKLSEKQTADVVVNEPVVETFVEKEKETSGDDVDSIIQQILADTAPFEIVIGADVVVNEPVVETFVEKEKETSGDDVDSIIQQILADTAPFEIVIGEPKVTDFEELVSSNADGITVGDTEQLVAAEGQQLQGTETEEERYHRSIFSKCWIRAKLMEDGTWLILEGVDFWRPISQPVDSRRWETVPKLFVAWLSAPVGSVVSCRDIVIHSSAVDILERLPNSFCGIFQQGQDTNSFVGYFSDSVDQQSDSSFSSDQLDFHVNSPDDEKTSTDQFDFVADTPAVGTAPAPTQSSLSPLAQMSLPVTTDVYAYFAELRASISRLIANQTRDYRRFGDSHAEVKSRIKHLEKALLDTLSEQDQSFRGVTLQNP